MLARLFVLCAAILACAAPGERVSPSQASSVVAIYFGPESPLVRSNPTWPSVPEIQPTTGVVFARFDLDSGGEPERPYVVASDLPAEYGDAVVDSIRRWRFQPPEEPGDAGCLLVAFLLGDVGPNLSVLGSSYSGSYDCGGVR
ncbi:MAG: energy transducer TonB [Alphaproteobacteria bacterium]|nr:energy transducer TonB [Alphaproteobacteria bacterium]